VTADLVVENLTVRFAGLTAVDGVNLHAPAGVITGLIGPNGAGKTTTFNACTGVVTPASGRVRLGEHTLDGHTPARRAQWGLGRTFQRMALFDSMSALDNVAMGLECRYAGRGLRGQLWATRKERTECLTTARAAMDRCGIAHLGTVLAANLTTGQRRLVELARAMTGGFSFLLLDEPSSGLDEHETEAFGAVLVDVAAQDGTGVVLVEHDVALVRDVCRDLYVLDFGKLIAEGPCADVLESDIVRAAYLGSLDEAAVSS
jgi:ABC-type branched-subunit amino acid transport system ATPase component